MAAIFARLVIKASVNPSAKYSLLWIAREIFQRQHGEGLNALLFGFQLRDESVAATRQGFDKTGGLRSVAEGFPQPFDCVINAVVKIDEGIGRPYPLPNLFAGHYLPWLFQQNLQDLERLLLQPDLRAVLT